MVIQGPRAGRSKRPPTHSRWEGWPGSGPFPGHTRNHSAAAGVAPAWPSTGVHTLVHVCAQDLCHRDEETLALQSFYELRNRSVLGVLKTVGFLS